MSNRFLHDQFNMSVICPHCQGQGERTLHAEGHFDHSQSFVLTGLADENGKEIIPTDAEREAIETKGDSRYGEVQQENADHQRELRRELNAEIKL